MVGSGSGRQWQGSAGDSGMTKVCANPRQPTRRGGQRLGVKKSSGSGSSERSSGTRTGSL